MIGVAVIRDPGFRYRGPGGIDSVCDVVIESNRRGCVVTVSRHPPRPGASATSAAAFIATRVCDDYRLVDPATARWVQHCPRTRFSAGAWYELTFCWRGRVASHLWWRNLGEEGYERLRGELRSPAEALDRSARS